MIIDNAFRNFEKLKIDTVRRQIRRLTQPILWRFYKWYLSKDRWYEYKGLSVKIASSVFHPGLLFSTKILLEFVLKLELKEKKILELGAGSGMISAVVCRVGGLVTATDINPVAVQAMKESKEFNKLNFNILESDLFQNIPTQVFDFILINPPYFPKEPETDREKAFFCGSNFEYFYRLFEEVSNYMNRATDIYMILSDDCNIEKISSIAVENGLSWNLVYQEKVWGETNFIFKIHTL